MTATDRTLAENVRLVAVVGVVQATLYFSLNHSPLCPSRPLPLTWVDRAVPFWTWTVWPYLLLLSSDLLLPLLLRGRAVVSRLLVAHVTAMSLAFLTFLLVPTCYPRPPLPDGDGLNETVYRWLTWCDSPECCCPSGHIIVPALGCWAVWRDGHPHRRAIATVIAVLMPTILTTKQHYLWDLLGGLLAAGVGIVVAKVAFREAGSVPAPSAEATPADRLAAASDCAK